MKSKFTFLLLLAILLNCSYLTAQYRGVPGNQTRFLGWIDDTHFIMQTVDESGKPKVTNNDCRTGKVIDIPEYKSEMELLREALPEGMELRYDVAVTEDRKAIIFTSENDLFFFRVGDPAPKRLTNDNAKEVNARFSPDGRKAAYTKDKDLYVYDLDAGKEIRLTFDAAERIYNGWASWVYYEEILGRASRYAAFWWSPDGTRLAYLHTDDNPVPVFNIIGLEDTDGVHGRIESTPYPKPGDPNPKVKMGIAEIATGKTTWVKTDESVDQYIAWPSWTPDSRSLMIQVLNRDQNDMRFILADVTTGDYKEIYRESRPTWVEFFEDVYVMKDGSGYLLRSYRSDWHNLYYYGWDGRLIARLTDLNWKVTGIERVDEAKQVVYFTGTGPDALENHLFKVNLDGSRFQAVTTGEGSHNASVSPGGSYFIDVWSSINDPGGINLIDKKGKVVRSISREKAPVFDPSKHSRTEISSVKTSDGLFDLPVMITYPVGFDPSVRYPVVFTVYGGPDAGSISDSWIGFRPRWYAENGIITVNVDHRGSGKFGKKGLDYMYRNLGKWEMSDYSDVVKWLREKSWADPGRMGITGGSYGGYVTCLALTKGSEYWTHGIADYSVTDYRLYDNVYTERFMDTPLENPEGYNAASAVTYAADLKGKLLIRHGDMDDNVHMQNVIWFITRLQDLNKPFEMMIYPGERHGWGGPKRAFMTNEANRFWLREFFDKE